MIKRIFSLLLCFLLAFSLCACNSGGNSTETPDISELQQPDTDAPAHEHLYHQSEEMLIYAHHAEDTGVALQADYFYGMALAPISSLRFCVDNILWLKGEGETVADIVSAAPFGDWDAIVGAGLGSPMPFFFEGLLFTFQGKNDEAAECYKKAEANSNYTEMDFNYLKSMSIDAVYTEFSANGYLTAPEGAAAVCVPMWKISDDNELYLLNRAHSYTSAVTPPTCTEQGYTTHTCACGDSYVNAYVDVLEHHYSAGLCVACGEDTVSVSLEGSTLTITGEFVKGTRMIVVGYSGNGRFDEARFLIWQGNPITAELPHMEAVKLLFVDQKWSPLRPPIPLK